MYENRLHEVLFHRHPRNPILRPEDWPYPINTVFNPAVTRLPASELQPDSDLGARPVTRGVGILSESEIEIALEAGADCARRLLSAGLIEGAALRLQGETILVGARRAGSQALQECPLEHQA